MRSVTRLRLTRLAMLWYVACTGASILAYPGGTPSDPSTHGYSLLHSPLSTLGRTVAWNGQSNSLGAALFVIGLTPAGAALVLFFLTVLPLFDAPKTSIWLARIGCSAGIVAGLAYVIVAWAPTDLHPRLHGLSNLLAWRACLVASVLLGAATAWSPAFSRRAVAGWLSFAALLGVFIVIVNVAPRGPIQVVAQKVIVLSTLLVVVFESYEAERVSPAA